MGEPKGHNVRERLGVGLRRRYGARLRRRIGAHLRRTLITGSLLLIPVALTYLLLRFIFDLVDGVLQPGIQLLLERLGVDWTVPGLGVVVAVAFIYLAGFTFASAMGRRVVGWGQAAVLRMPLIGTVYSATRRLVESFSGTEETGFKRVVMVQYPRLGAWSIGFLTAITSTTAGGRYAVVYIPTAPLPNSGWVAVVPVDDVLDTDLSVRAAMQMVFSGGILSPDEIKTSKLEEASSLTGVSTEDE